MKTVLSLSLALIAGTLAASPAVAQGAVSGGEHNEVSIRALLNPGGDTATLYGGAGISHRSGSFYFGGAGYGGPVVTERRGGFGYGGFLLGASDTFAGTGTYDARLLVGGGGGAIGGDGAGGFALEPSVGVGVILPNQSKVSLTAGYLYMPSASQFSGATVGLRFVH